MDCFPENHPADDNPDSRGQRAKHLSPCLFVLGMGVSRLSKAVALDDCGVDVPNGTGVLSPALVRNGGLCNRLAADCGGIPALSARYHARHRTAVDEITTRRFPPDPFP